MSGPGVWTLLWALLGCAAEEDVAVEVAARGEAVETACGVGPRHWQTWATTDQTGLVEIPVEVTEGEPGFYVHVRALDVIADTAMVYVLAPDGSRVWGLDWEEDPLPWRASVPAVRSAYVWPVTVAGATFAWPALAGEAIRAGTWRVGVATTQKATSMPIGEQSVQVDVSVRPADDGDPCLPVVMAIPDDDPDVADAFLAAAELAAAWWAEQGVPWALETTTVGADLPVGYDNYRVHVEGLSALAEAFPGRLPILVGHADETWLDGLIGFTSLGPGVPEEGDYAGIVVDVETSAAAHGPEVGPWSEDEVGGLAYVIAHEAGHWLGLAHPVGFTSGTPTSVDTLDDTPTCEEDNEACVRSMDSNLMYYYAIRSTVEAANLTEGQLDTVRQAPAVY